MANPSKQKGTMAETAVVRYLQAHNIEARRPALAGANDVGDILASRERLCFEVKNYNSDEISEGQMRKFFRETDEERVNSGAHMGILVVKRKGYGGPNAGHWFAYVRIRSLVPLLYQGSFPTNSGTLDPWVRMTLSELVVILAASGYAGGVFAA